MMNLLRMIPIKAWIGVGIILLLIFTFQVGTWKGYTEAESDFNKASLKAVESRISDLNVTLTETIAYQLKFKEEAEKLNDAISKSKDKHREELKEEVKDAKESSQGTDCDDLPDEYIRMLKSIYPEN